MMISIPDGNLPPALRQIDPNALFPRGDAAEALTKAGLPCSPKTLATLACRGNGPPYSRFGRVSVYRGEDLVSWAIRRMSRPARTACEHKARAGSQLQSIEAR